MCVTNCIVQIQQLQLTITQTHIKNHVHVEFSIRQTNSVHKHNGFRSSTMYCCAAHSAAPNISEEHSHFTFKGQAVSSCTARTLTTNVPFSPKMLPTTHPMTQCHIPEEQNPYQHCSKNLRTRRAAYTSYIQQETHTPFKLQNTTLCPSKKPDQLGVRRENTEG